MTETTPTPAPGGVPALGLWFRENYSMTTVLALSFVLLGLPVAVLIWVVVTGGNPLSWLSVFIPFILVAYSIELKHRRAARADRDARSTAGQGSSGGVDFVAGGDSGGDGGGDGGD